MKIKLVASAIINEKELKGSSSSQLMGSFSKIIVTIKHDVFSSGQFETASMGPSTPGLQSTTPQPNPSVASVTPPSKKQHVALKAKTLEGEGPFSNHCRSFDSQIKVSERCISKND
jgi:hypothetical protein